MFNEVAPTSGADIREKAVSVFGLFGMASRSELQSCHDLTYKQRNRRLDAADADQ